MSPQNFLASNQPTVPTSSSPTAKKPIRIILSIAIVAATCFGIGYGLYHWSKTRLTKEEQALQKMSEEMGKYTFDLDGKIVSVAADGKSLVVKTDAVSKTIAQYQGKETKLQIVDNIKIVSKEQKDIKITDLKANDSVNIKGSIEKENLVAEFIALR